MTRPPELVRAGTLARCSRDDFAAHAKGTCNQFDCEIGQQFKPSQTRLSDASEWHLVLAKFIEDITFGFVSWFHESIVRFRSPLFLRGSKRSGHPNVDWSKEAPAFPENVIRHVEKLGSTDLNRRIRFEKIVTPDDWDPSCEFSIGSTINSMPNTRFVAPCRNLIARKTATTIIPLM